MKSAARASGPARAWAIRPFIPMRTPSRRASADSAIQPTEAFYSKDLGEFLLPYEPFAPHRRPMRC